MKLMYDEVSLGEIEDHSELSEYLESYSTDYFIGLESDQGWSKAVLTQVLHLFSIGRDPEKVHLKVAIASLLLYNTRCNVPDCTYRSVIMSIVRHRSKYHCSIR